MDFELDGRTAVITGGSRGLGAEMARSLAAEGAHVVVWDRDETAAELAAELTAAGASASSVIADVTRPAEVTAAVDSIVAARTRIDALVNCAGFSRDAPIVEMTDQDWHDVIDVCLHGTFYVTRAVVPHMIERGFGRIVNVSSRAQFGDVNKVNYCAAKAGLVGFTAGLALELGKHDITANAIAPGYCETERASTIPTAAQLKEHTLAKTPTARLGTPHDIADTVIYLLSPRSGYVSGELITVAGGRWR